VLLMNNGNTAADLALAFKDIPGVRCTRCHVRDIWAKRDLGDFDGGFVAKAVAAHARRAFPRAHAGRRGEWCLANRQSQSYRLDRGGLRRHVAGTRPRKLESVSYLPPKFPRSHH
jgi:hypothetical protein